MKRGFYLWNIPNCENGDPAVIAGTAVNAGLSDVFVKVADGPYRFNVTEKGRDLVPDVVAALRAVGVRVWGWQYVYGYNPAAEAKVAAARINELKLDGFIVDAEQEMKKNGASAATRYLKDLRAATRELELAVSSYRFPHYHMDFPWAPYLTYCDVNMPQVYWLQAHNSADQTRICFERFRSMSQLPIMPTGPAWKENGWRPSLSEIQEFERVSASFGAPLVSYWSWEHCRRDLPELWPKAPVPDDQLATIEKKVTAAEQLLATLSVSLTEIRTLLTGVTDERHSQP
jgi:hypothetical protein